MPITPTYPGVYIEEIPSGVRTITGVSTSVTAFIGYTPAGPANHPKQLFNFGEYERIFGGLHKDSPLSYGVSQFFLNGGGEAWIVRVAQGTATASVTISNPSATPTDVLDIEAKSAGKWGNYLRLDVDYDTTNPDASFNLGVTELVTRGQDLVPNRVESFRNLSMNSESPFYVEKVVEATSDLIKAKRNAAFAGEIATLPAGKSISGTITLPGDLASTSGHNIVVSVDGKPAVTVPAFDPNSPPPATIPLLRQSIVAAINAELGTNAVSGSESGTATSGVIELESGTNGDETSAVTISNAANNDVAAALHLGVANGGTEIPATSSLRPAQTGTVGIDITDKTATDLNNKSLELEISTVAGGTQPAETVNFGAEFSDPMVVNEVATTLQEKIRTLHPDQTLYSNAEVSVVNGALRVVMGGPSPNPVVTFDNPGGLATQLGIRHDQTGVNNNVTRYALGIGEMSEDQTNATQGTDGSKGGVTELIGSESDKTGIYALADVDIFNILCIPESASLSDAEAKTLIGKAAAYAQERRAFYIVDPPDVGGATPEKIKEWHAKLGLQSKNSAIYFPRVRLSDPLENYRVGPFAPSGTMAGLYARTDSARGVWKAPAGTEAGLRVAGLDSPMTDDQNGVLNKLGINCLRTFPIYGRVSWGARTFEGADQKASEWKYVPVRRTALFIEESLFRGLKWAVFEPNGETLWAQIRVAAGGFMNNLFRQGAFKGTSPREAYFVKCDAETTTQNDIDLGIVNVMVGFAPLKPAEFVVIKIQQIAGQVQT